MSFLRQVFEGRAWATTGGAPEPARPGQDLAATYGQTGGSDPGYGQWLPGMRWDPWSGGGQSTDQAMRLSAVFACLRLLTDALSTLPLDTYQRVNGTRSPFRPRPDYLSFNPPQLSRITYLSQVMLSLLTDGNAYVATPRDEYGVPLTLWVLDPTRVEPYQRRDSSIVFRVDVGKNQPVEFGSLDIMHIAGMMLPGKIKGVSPLRAAREVIDSGMKTQEYGTNFMANAGLPPAVISVPGTADTGKGGETDTDKARRIASAWNETHAGPANAGRVGVLLGGATLNTVAVSPQDAQWLDSKRFGVSEIARFYGVPPHLIADASNSTSWGSGLAEQNLAFGQFSLRPWTERIEEAHARLLTSHGLPDVFVKLNLDALLRASLKDRYESYQVGIASKFLLPNEARRYEDMPPLKGGDQFPDPPAAPSPGGAP